MEFIEINLLFFLVTLSSAANAIAANSQSMQTEASTTESTSTTPSSASSSLSLSSSSAAAPPAAAVREGALTEATEEAGGSTEKLLSRKRRYLLFPEGSSFQLVYDEVIGVVDYTNYLILGITVALAWELPSKPPSEQLEDLRTRLQDGTLDISRNDTITKIKYYDNNKETSRKALSPSPTVPPFNMDNEVPLRATHKSDANANFGANPFYVPMHPNFYLYSNNKRAQSYRYQNLNSSPSSLSSSSSYDRHHYRPSNGNAYYYHNKRRNPFQSFIPNNSNQERASKYPWWNLSNRLSNSWEQRKKARLQQQQHQYNQQAQQNNGFRQSTSVRKHRIFPVFGKRSTVSLKNVPISSSAATNSTSTITAESQQRLQQNYFISRYGVGIVNHHRDHQQGQQQHRHHLNKQNLLYIRHHRQTRQTLYEKIELYLNKRGMDGHHCVLRALCETGQKSKDYEPGSFIAELMRTIFTLPEPLESHESPMMPLERMQAKHKRYDVANAYIGDCASRYQHCKQSLWTSEFIL